MSPQLTQSFLRGEALLPFPLVGCGGAELNMDSGSTSKIVVPINLGNPSEGCNHLEKHLVTKLTLCCNDFA